MELTKKERHEVYKKALSLIEKEHYICHCFLHIRIPYYYMEEFLLFTPKNWVRGMSFGDQTFHNGEIIYGAFEEYGLKFRKTILQLCIEMTK